MFAARLEGVDIRRSVLFELEPALLECLHDLRAVPKGHENVVGEVGCDEEDGSNVASALDRLACNNNTHMPARARGLVSSRTRWPASSPSPSTCMTTKSSGVMLTDSLDSASSRARTGTNSSLASALEHTIEHSTGVIEMFTKGCSQGQPFRGCTAPEPLSKPSRVALGNTSWRMD